MRVLLNKRLSHGLLNSNQTLEAKKIIHDLNRDVVSKMTQLLNISEQAMTPKQLISVITLKRNSGTLGEKIENKIKQVMYVNKLKALKRLVSLIRISRDSGDLPIPPNTPQDLIDSIFSSSMDLSEVKGKIY